MVVFQHDDPEQDEHCFPLTRPGKGTGQRHLGKAQDHVCFFYQEMRD